MERDRTDAEQRYRRLRSWYLAKLRSTAIRDILGAEGDSMTPSTLIRADSQLIQRLVAAESPVPGQVRDRWVATDAEVKLLLLTAGILALAIVCLPLFL